MLNKKSSSTLLALSLAAFCVNTQAQGASSYQLIAPTCLLKEITERHTTLAKTPAFSLIVVNEKGLDQLIEAKHLLHSRACGGFMDVSEAWKEYNTSGVTTKQAQSFLQSYTHSLPKAASLQKTNYSVKYEKQVGALLNQLSPQNMWKNLSVLTNFKDRFANSENGVAAANWLKTEVEAIASQYGRKDVSFNFIPTGNRYKQPSLVVKVGQSNEAGIVIGGHMDTLNSIFEVKPGADDDGSGSVTVLEVARTLLSSGMQFKKPIYFIWYSAEEMGLVGSQYVVADFKKKNIPVAAVLQLDMTGYAYKNDPTLWLMDDYVDPDLTAFVETLIHTYVKQPVKHSACGYACSDHASWTKGGFASAVPFESSMEHDNPAIHSAQDTMDKLSLDHMSDYAKLATAFMVELAEPLA